MTYPNFISLSLLVSAIFIAASPTPTPFDPTKIDFSQFNPEEIAATERHRDELKNEVRQAHERQTEVIQDQGANIVEIQAAAEETERSFNAYKSAAEAQINKGNQAITALDHVLRKLHIAKWILSGIWVALCALIAFRIPWIGMYVGGAMGVAGIAWIWFWI